MSTPAGVRANRPWLLLWLLPFVWFATLGEALHNHVPLPQRVTARAAGVSLVGRSVPGSRGDVKAAAHRSQSASECSACR